MRDELRSEAIVFGKYLVDCEPGEDLIARYCQANEELFAGQGSTAERAVVDFARRHPWSVPMLDAADGVTAAGSLLRKKLLVMTAILETTPTFVDRTEPRTVGLPQLALRLAASGARTACWVAAGVVLSAIVRRRG